MERTVEKTISEKPKKLIITKKVGLNGKQGERRTKSRSRAARVKVGESRQKVKDEPRHQTPSGRDQPEKQKIKKNKKKPIKKTTRIRASLPKPKGSINPLDHADYHDSKPDEEEKDAVVDESEDDSEELRENEPSIVGNEEEEEEKTQGEVDDKTVDDKTIDDKTVDDKTVDDVLSTGGEGGEKTVVDEQQTEEESPFQTAIKTADAVIYSLGKFIGENTCHHPITSQTSGDIQSKEVISKEETKPNDATTSSNDSDNVSVAEKSASDEDYAHLKAQMGHLYDDEGNFIGLNKDGTNSVSAKNVNNPDVAVSVES